MTTKLTWMNPEPAPKPAIDPEVRMKHGKVDLSIGQYQDGRHYLHFYLSFGMFQDGSLEDAKADWPRKAIERARAAINEFEAALEGSDNDE